MGLLVKSHQVCLVRLVGLLRATQSGPLGNVDDFLLVHALCHALSQRDVRCASRSLSPLLSRASHVQSCAWISLALVSMKDAS